MGCSRSDVRRQVGEDLAARRRPGFRSGRQALPGGLRPVVHVEAKLVLAAGAHDRTRQDHVGSLRHVGRRRISAAAAHGNASQARTTQRRVRVPPSLVTLGFSHDT